MVGTEFGNNACDGDGVLHVLRKLFLDAERNLKIELGCADEDGRQGRQQKRNGQYLMHPANTTGADEAFLTLCPTNQHPVSMLCPSRGRRR